MPHTLSACIEQRGASTCHGTVRSHMVAIDRPFAKGGADHGAMGGELLLVALGGCFTSHLLAAIRARDANVRDVRVAVDGTMDGAPERFVAFTLRVEATHDSPELLGKLVTIAERSCQVLNTLRQAASVTVSVG